MQTKFPVIPSTISGRRRDNIQPTYDFCWALRMYLFTSRQKHWTFHRTPSIGSTLGKSRLFSPVSMNFTKKLWWKNAINSMNILVKLQTVCFRSSTRDGEKMQINKRMKLNGKWRKSNQTAPNASRRMLNNSQAVSQTLEAHNFLDFHQWTHTNSDWSVRSVPKTVESDHVHADLFCVSEM